MQLQVLENIFLKKHNDWQIKMNRLHMCDDFTARNSEQEVSEKPNLWFKNIYSLELTDLSLLAYDKENLKCFFLGRWRVIGELFYGQLKKQLKNFHYIRRRQEKSGNNRKTGSVQAALCTFLDLSTTIVCEILNFLIWLSCHTVNNHKKKFLF